MYCICGATYCRGRVRVGINIFTTQEAFTLIHMIFLHLSQWLLLTYYPMCSTSFPLPPFRSPLYLRSFLMLFLLSLFSFPHLPFLSTPTNQFPSIPSPFPPFPSAASGLYSYIIHRDAALTCYLCCPVLRPRVGVPPPVSPPPFLILLPPSLFSSLLLPLSLPPHDCISSQRHGG